MDHEHGPNCAPDPVTAATTMLLLGMDKQTAVGTIVTWLSNIAAAQVVNNGQSPEAAWIETVQGFQQNLLMALNDVKAQYEEEIPRLMAEILQSEIDSELT